MQLRIRDASASTDTAGSTDFPQRVIQRPVPDGCITLAMPPVRRNNISAAVSASRYCEEQAGFHRAAGAGNNIRHASAGAAEVLTIQTLSPPTSRESPSPGLQSDHNLLAATSGPKRVYSDVRQQAPKTPPDRQDKRMLPASADLNLYGCRRNRTKATNTASRRSHQRC